MGLWFRPSVLPGKPTSVAGNNHIHANRVEEHVSLLHDAGAIYTLGNQPGTVIDRNYVRRSEKAMYTDEGSTGIYSHDNVVQSPYYMAHWADNFGRKHDITVDHYFVTENKFTVEAPGCTVTNTVLCQAGQPGRRKRRPSSTKADSNQRGVPSSRRIGSRCRRRSGRHRSGVDQETSVDFVLTRHRQ
jgi:hypothetical protein